MKKIELNKWNVILIMYIILLIRKNDFLNCATNEGRNEVIESLSVNKTKA